MSTTFKLIPNTHPLYLGSIEVNNPVYNDLADKLIKDNRDRFIATISKIDYPTLNSRFRKSLISKWVLTIFDINVYIERELNVYYTSRKQYKAYSNRLGKIYELQHWGSKYLLNKTYGKMGTL